MDDARIQRQAPLLIGAIIAISLLLFARQATYSLNYNESHNLLYAASRSPAELLKIDDMHPPGFYLLMHYWQDIAGRSEVLLRLPSLFFAVIAIVLVYALGKRLYNEKVAIAGALIFAISPMQANASSSARPYSLFTLFFLISLLCFLGILERNKNLPHVINSGSAFAALFLHYYGIFLPAYQFVYLLLDFRRRKNQLKKWLLFQGIVALAFLPFAYIAVTHQLRMVNPSGGAGILTPANLISLLYAVTPLSQRFYASVTPWAALIALFFLGLALLGAFPFEKNGLLIIYLVLPVAVAGIVSNLARLKFVQAYHFVFLLPAFSLLVARGLFKLGRIGLAAGALILLVGVTSPIKSPVPDWKVCSDYLRANAQMGDMVMVCPELNDALLYYWPGAGIITLDQIDQGSRKPRRIWLILVYEGIYFDQTAKDLLIGWFNHLGFESEPVNENIKNVSVMLLSR